MAQQRIPRLSRRDFLRLSGLGALSLTAGRVLSTAGREPARALAAPAAAPAPVFIRLAATDGFMLLPGREANPLYAFGFVSVPVDATLAELDVYKGNVQWPAPIIGVDQDADVYITLTNLGLVIRPDLDDSHTIHWHGFRNAIALFDGVPEASISVPVARDFPYFYRPHDPGTYMYHCHFEDVEHVQLGMDGIVFVRPSQNNGTGNIPAGKYVYNDGVQPTDAKTTSYKREFALLLNDVDTRPHDNLASIQEFIWSDYKPNYWVINGRAYPDTIKPNDDPSLPSQPLSSLVQCNPNDRVLLRLVNLGYEQHAMQLPGISMKVVGEDATLLRGPAGADLSYFTNTVYIGPGEARDVIFVAPAFDALAQVFDDGNGLGQYNKYLFKNRSYHKQTNNGLPGMGGMITEVRVYQNALPAQTAPNQTYP